MVRVSGPLVNVTTSASSVRDVQVHTKKVRAWGDGLMTPDPSQAKLSNGVVEFEAAPGPVVMVLFLVEAGAETVSLVVGEGATQSLADAYRDGQMASDRDASELAGILEQIRGSVVASAEARAGAEAAAEDAAGSAASAGRDATRAETAEAGAVEAEEGAEAGQELSEDAAAVAVAAALAVGEAADDIKWVKRDLTISDRLESLHPGLYGVINSSIATAVGMPVPRYGTLEISPARIGIGDIKSAVFTTNEVSVSTVQEIWVSATNNLGEWQSWKRVFPLDPQSVDSRVSTYIEENRVSWAQRNLTTSDSISTLGPGLYAVPNGAVFTALGLPTVSSGQRAGSIEIFPTNLDSPNVLTAVWRTNHLSVTSPLEMWVSATDNLGEWQEWQQVLPANGATTPPTTPPPPATTGLVDAGLGNEMHRRRLMDRHGGLIHVGAATPVCFVWDDYPDYMHEYGIIEEIERLGLKINFALASQSLGEMKASLRGERTTWEQIDSWIQTGLVEVSNHSRRHRPATTREEIYSEIVTAKQELEANLPSAGVIDTWVQPATEYPGFDNGKTLENYYTTLAGKQIAANHAYFTGSYAHRGDVSVRMNGQVMPGLGRLWVDSRTDGGLFGRDRIQACYGTDRGYILGTHASTLGEEGRWTAEQAFEFLQWLADEQDAGRIRMMHLSEWPYAVNDYSDPLNGNSIPAPVKDIQDRAILNVTFQKRDDNWGFMEDGSQSVSLDAGTYEVVSYTKTGAHPAYARLNPGGRDADFSQYGFTATAVVDANQGDDLWINAGAMGIGETVTVSIIPE